MKTIKPLQVFKLSLGMMIICKEADLTKGEVICLEGVKPKRKWVVQHTEFLGESQIRVNLKAEKPKPSETLKESSEQQKFVKIFRKVFPDFWLYKITNEGKRPNGRRLVYEGLSSGVPDMHVPALDLYIEIKREKGGVISENQIKWAAHLEKNGKKVLFPNGCKEGLLQVVEYLKESWPNLWAKFSRSPEYLTLKHELEKL